MPRGRPRKVLEAPVEEKQKIPEEVRKTFTKKQDAAHYVCHKVKSAEEMRELCDAYFADCDEKGTLYSESGLALWLDISLNTLHSWWDGTYSPHLMEETRRAYLRIQNQLESDVRYFDKALNTRAIFLMKQKRLGGKQDKIETSNDVNVNVKFGENMDASDWG